MVSSLALQAESKTNLLQENELREFSHNSLFQAPSLTRQCTFPLFSLTAIGNNKIDLLQNSFDGRLRDLLFCSI